MAEAALLSDAVAFSPPAPETSELVPIGAAGEGPGAAQPTSAAAQPTPAAAPRRLKLPPYELEAALRLAHEAAVFDRVEFIPLGATRVLVVIVARGGHVIQKMIDIGESLDSDDLRQASAYLNGRSQCEMDDLAVLRFMLWDRS